MIFNSGNFQVFARYVPSYRHTHNPITYYFHYFPFRAYTTYTSFPPHLLSSSPPHLLTSSPFPHFHFTIIISPTSPTSLSFAPSASGSKILKIIHETASSGPCTLTSYDSPTVPLRDQNPSILSSFATNIPLRNPFSLSYPITIE